MAEKRAALVTGASYGVGAATALALARDGFDVAVTATKLENLTTTLKALEGIGARVVPAILDLRSQASIAQAADNIAAAFGEMDLLVNNAGGNGREPARHVFSHPACRPPSYRRGAGRVHRQYRLDLRVGRRRRALDLRHLQGCADRHDADAGGGMGKAQHPRQCRGARPQLR